MHLLHIYVVPVLVGILSLTGVSWGQSVLSCEAGVCSGVAYSPFDAWGVEKYSNDSEPSSEPVDYLSCNYTGTAPNNTLDLDFNGTRIDVYLIIRNTSITSTQFTLSGIGIEHTLIKPFEHVPQEGDPDFQDRLAFSSPDMVYGSYSVQLKTLDIEGQEDTQAYFVGFLNATYTSSDTGPGLIIVSASSSPSIRPSVPAIIGIVLGSLSFAILLTLVGLRYWKIQKRKKARISGGGAAKGTAFELRLKNAGLVPQSQQQPALPERA